MGDAKNRSVKRTILLSIIKAYARIGNHAAVDDFLKSGNRELKMRKAHVKRAAIEGYAYHYDVEEFRARITGLLNSENDKKVLYKALPHEIASKMFEEIPHQYKHYTFQNAAKLGDDDFINKHFDTYLLSSDMPEEMKMGHCKMIYKYYFHFGHPKAAHKFREDKKLNFELSGESLEGLVTFAGINAVTKFHVKRGELDPLAFTLKNTQISANDYMQNTIMGKLCSLVPISQKSKSAMLIQIEDDVIRKQLLWITAGGDPFNVPASFPQWDALNRVKKYSSRLRLEFDTAFIFENNSNLQNIFNLTLIRLHKKDGVLLSQDAIIDSIVAHLLNTSLEKAHKIQTYFFDSLKWTLKNFRERQKEEASKKAALSRSSSPDLDSLDISSPYRSGSPVIFSPAPSRSSSPDLDSLDISSPYRDQSLTMFSPAPSRSPSPERPRSPSPTLRRMG